jgi:hypothetical protein
MVPEATMANTSPFRLGDGARVAVIGGGPAGAFFAHYLLGMAAQAGRRIAVDIYEPRDFKQTGAHGCNGCAGIVSERLVQTMAADGIELPATVVQRNIDSYVVHMDAGSAAITPPRPGTRIAAVHRGAGPRDLHHTGWTGLDAYVLGLAVTTGVNSAVLKLNSEITPGYQPPQTSKTFIREYFLGAATVDATLGNDNQVGRLIFAVVSQLSQRPFARTAILQTILDEQGQPGPLRPMSAVQWDMYTGSGS